MTKTVLAALAILPLAGCAAQVQQAVGYLNSGAAIIASINGAMPKACAAVVQQAGDVGAAVNQAAAANPHNAKLQAVAAKVNANQPLVASDCAAVSAALAKF